MTEGEIRMLAKLRSLECLKSYWEGELLFWTNKGEGSVEVVSRYKDVAQEHLYELSQRFETEV